MKMLDTNICIYTIKHKPIEVLNRFKQEIFNGLCISAITLAELKHGIEKSAKPEKNEPALAQLLTALTVIPFDLVTNNTREFERIPNLSLENWVENN